MQSQLFMESIELILDLQRTGTVLPCTESQEDVDLQDKDRKNNEVRRGKKKRKGKKGNRKKSKKWINKEKKNEKKKAIEENTSLQTHEKNKWKKDGK